MNILRHINCVICIENLNAIQEQKIVDEIPIALGSETACMAGYLHDRFFINKWTSNYRSEKNIYSVETEKARMNYGRDLAGKAGSLPYLFGLRCGQKYVILTCEKSGFMIHGLLHHK